MGKVFYKSEVGDLVCLVDHTWDYCGFGTVLKTFVNGMCEVYWYDLEEVALEYDTELALCEEVDMKKCRSRIRLRNELLDRFYG